MHKISNQPCSNLEKNQLSHIQPIILRAGNHLFRMGEETDCIFLLNSGAIKVYRVSENGYEHIVEFTMPGEILGIDAVVDGVAMSSALILDTSSVTPIPIKSLYSENQCFDRKEIVKKIADSLLREVDHSVMLSQKTADKRLAWFLLRFSEKLRGRQLSAREFALPMTQTDLAQYLGIAVETICREFSHFVTSGLISKQRRNIKINNLMELQKILGEEKDDIKNAA